MTRAAFLLLPTVAVALTIAVFLPYGVLAATLPLPGQGGFSATFGAAALSLLICGLATLTDVPDELFGVGELVRAFELVPLLVALGPVVVVVAAYAKQANFWWLAYVLFASPLWLAGALALGATATGSRPTAVPSWRRSRWRPSRSRSGRARASPGRARVPVAVLPTLLGVGVTVWFVVWGFDTGLADDAVFGRAFLAAAVLMSGVHAIALVLVRQLAAALVVRHPKVVQAIARGEIWAIVEADEPPLYKSFVEVDVVPGKTVTIRAFGVSGYEADADKPVEFDSVAVHVSGTPPTQRPAAAPASPA